MSFFDWLRSGGKGTGPSDAAPKAWSEKRRHNRVRVEPGHRIEIELTGPGDDAHVRIKATVRDVSLRGCRVEFSAAGEAERFEPGSLWQGLMSIDGTQVPVSIEARRLVSPTEVGMRFRPPFPRELERLERFLEPRCLGMSMREIDPASIQQTDTKGLRWFQGVNDTNLFSWHEPGTGRVVQQQMVFLGNAVEWREGAGVRTGRIEPDSPATSYGWIKSELLGFHRRPDRDMIEQAAAVLRFAHIDRAVKDLFLSKLEEASKTSE